MMVGGMTAVVGLGGLVTGCSTWGQHKGDRTAGQVVDDNRITDQVETRLKSEPVYKFENVDVRTYGGVVQLSGFVRTDAQKERAGELANGIAGVNRVINSIALQPEAGPTPTGRSNTNNLISPNNPNHNNPPREQ
jgi:hypothetical protein